MIFKCFYHMFFLPIFTLILCTQGSQSGYGMGNVFDLKYWKCILKRGNSCPDNDIKFYMYRNETGRARIPIDIRNPRALKQCGFNPKEKITIIVHGFNGTESKTPITLLRNAYLSRNDYNIFTIDWNPLTLFPCYLSALSNMKLVSQCTAKLYAFIMDSGGDALKTTCVGHSLGAHICGMMSNHLTIKQHTIIGLDPAMPLISEYANNHFTLTINDAHHVQIIHTNAGILGDVNQLGHVDFCVNGGSNQPGCKGHILRRARCSHHQGVCYFATTVRKRNAYLGKPCSSNCPKVGRNWRYLPGKAIPMGEDTPFGARGMYCVDTHSNNDCPFD